MRSRGTNKPPGSTSLDDLPVVVLPDDVDFVERDDSDPGVGVAVADGSLLEELEHELTLEEEAGAVSIPRVFVVVGFVIGAALALLLTVGWQYYRMPLSSRPFHHLHSALRSSGTFGLSLGIVGTLLMLTSLIYLVRKRFVSWRWMGSLQNWMAFHIFSGLLGPALIMFHADFLPYSALGVFSSCAMAVVVVSGVVGRYIFVYFPRSLEGRDLELEAIHKRLTVYRKLLVDLGVSPSLLQIDAATTNKRAPWLIVAIIRVIYGDRQNQKEFKRLRTTVCANRKAGAQTRRVLSLVRRLCKERQWLMRYQEIRKLMGAWRFFHRWLAVVLLIAVFFHIAIAVDFGNLWLFGGAD